MLNKRLKNISRQRAFENFDTAKRIGIIFDSTHQESYLTAKSFIAGLKKKNIEIEAIGFVNNQEAIAYYPYHQGISFFLLDNTNWYMIPHDETVSDFVEHSFDMLINLSDVSHFTLQYIVEISNAKIKIGRSNPANSSYDLIFDLQKTKDLNFFIEQLKHYMAVMKAA